MQNSKTTRKKALVTGASGFIGSTLIEFLDQAGITPVALLRQTSSTRNLEGLNYERVEGDLRDQASLEKAVQGVDYVFHLAGIVVARTHLEFTEHNAGGTRRLAEAVARANPALKRFVYVSSLAAGGPCSGPDPRTELLADQPVSQYGRSKLEGEKELLKHKDVFPVAIVRPPIVYGPKDRAIFTVVQSVARNLMVIPHGRTEGGHKYYSAIHVHDLCQGLVRTITALPETSPSGEVFYLAGDGVVTYEEILKTMSECLGKKPLKIRVPGPMLTLAAHGMSFAGRVLNRTFPLNSDKLNEIMADYWVCSNEKAKRVLGFSPQYDLSTGMKHAIDWYKEKRWL